MALASDQISECPECKGTLTRETIRPGPFNCPYCAKYIRPVHRPRYLWVRGLICVILAVVTARWRGFDWSFLIFVVSFYALPLFVLWDLIVFKLSPPRKFEPVSSPFQTLTINKG